MTMLRKLSRSLIIGSIMTLAACGTARVIHRDQVGGVIELNGDRGKAMEQANQEMAAHCGPNNFTVVQEGEEAVGTDTFTREDQATDSKTSKSGRRAASDSTTTAEQSTRTATKWRVHYQCGGAAVGAGGPPPPGEPPPGPPPGPPPPPSGN
jgi:predicted phage gp36 major capsid-like protein